jgi:hypothetical protein
VDVDDFTNSGRKKWDSVSSYRWHRSRSWLIALRALQIPSDTIAS